MKVRSEAPQTGMDTRRATEGPAGVLDSTSRSLKERNAVDMSVSAAAVEASVESRMGALTDNAPAHFPSPLIEPDVRISRIRLSDRFQRQTHGRAFRCTARRCTTPSEPQMVSLGRVRVPRV